MNKTVISSLIVGSTIFFQAAVSRGADFDGLVKHEIRSGCLSIENKADSLECFRRADVYLKYPFSCAKSAQLSYQVGLPLAACAKFTSISGWGDRVAATGSQNRCVRGMTEQIDDPRAKKLLSDCKGPIYVGASSCYEGLQQLQADLALDNLNAAPANNTCAASQIAATTSASKPNDAAATAGSTREKALLNSSSAEIP